MLTSSFQHVHRHAGPICYRKLHHSQFLHSNLPQQFSEVSYPALAKQPAKLLLRTGLVRGNCQEEPAPAMPSRVPDRHQDTLPASHQCCRSRGTTDQLPISPSLLSNPARTSSETPGTQFHCPKSSTRCHLRRPRISEVPRQDYQGRRSIYPRSCLSRAAARRYHGASQMVCNTSSEYPQ